MPSFKGLRLPTTNAGNPIKSAITVGKYEEFLFIQPSIDPFYRLLHLVLSHRIQRELVVVAAVVVVVAVVIVDVEAVVDGCILLKQISSNRKSTNCIGKINITVVVVVAVVVVYDFY